MVDTQMAREPARFPPPPAGGDNDDWLTWAAESPGTRGLHIVPTLVSTAQARAYVDESVMALNPNGAFHGGVIAAICDQVISLAVMRHMPEGRAIVTGALNVDYLRPSYPRLDIRAWVDRRSRTLTFARAEIHCGGVLTVLSTCRFVSTDAPDWTLTATGSVRAEPVSER